jgi:two-component system, NarL family, nitrate/nitrite sensor histidine kinase NarX
MNATFQRASHRLQRASLAAKLGALGSLIMVVALGSIAFTVWVTWQLEGGAAAVNEAGRLRMQTWRYAQVASAQDVPQLPALAQQYDATLALLDAGDPARPLFVPRDADTRAALQAVRIRWQALQSAIASGAPPLQSGQLAGDLVAEIDHLVTGIEARLQRWTSILSALQFTLLALALAAGVALLYAAHLFIFQPLARLQRGLEAVARGDLGARVDVETHDEFGAVADGFNDMAMRLEDLYRGLETKVAEKTEHLHAERERLAALYEASRRVAQAASLDELAQGFVRQFREVARADAALLRWHDAEQGRMLMLAADRVPAAMLEHERCLAPGDCHCGNGASPTGPRTITIHALTDDTTDASAGACRRFGFQRVLTVPVLLQDQALGEVDLLWRDTTRPVLDDDRALLEGLAAQLAGGIESVRAQALQREAAVSEERGFIARELHDSIAQALAFMKIQLQMLRGALRRGDPTATTRVVDELDAGVRESLADVRELLLHFRTRSDGAELAAALRTTLQKFQHQTGLPAQLDVRGPVLPLAPDVQVQLLHVVQEALSNIRKHAQAKQVWVTLDPRPELSVTVSDDGRGFDSAARPGDGVDDGHVGLRIMRERAAGIGAEVEITSVPGEGTQVRIAVPARPASVALAA